jgi:hypothetical protein
MTDEHQKIADRFRGFFTAPMYDGSYGTDASDAARQSFSELTNCRIMWAQVHGDHKDPVKRATFEPYPHWTELYDCARSILKSHEELGTFFAGPVTCAKLMGQTMELLKKRYGYNVPRWWLPLMKVLRRDA